MLRGFAVRRNDDRNADDQQFSVCSEFGRNSSFLVEIETTSKLVSAVYAKLEQNLKKYRNILYVILPP